jgi:energy-coupling factor transporter ATP-binding protein EcfA2
LTGPSGSGKTTISKMLQQNIPHSMIISMDVIVRHIFNPYNNIEKIENGIELIKLMAAYAVENNFNVVFEGFWPTVTHNDDLIELTKMFDSYQAYYFNISFNETVRRHHASPNKGFFTPDQMIKWYDKSKPLGLKNEHIITDYTSEQDTLNVILTSF